MAWNRRHFLWLGLILLPSCASPTLKARLINAERRATEAEKLLDEAERQMAELEPAPAERAVKQAEQAMSDPDVGYYPERQQIRDRLAADLRKLPEVKRKREARDLAIAVDAHRVEIEKAFVEFTPAIAALRKPDVVRAEIDRAAETAGALKDAIDHGRDLEPKDQSYAAYVRRLRGFVDQSHAQIELAKKRLEFAAGPGKLRSEGLELAQLAKSERNRENRAKLRAKAMEKFNACANDGEHMLGQLPELAKAVTAIGNESLTPQAVVIGCIKRAHLLKQASRPLLKSASRAGR
jgi:hypothetical protein